MKHKMGVGMDRDFNKENTDVDHSLRGYLHGLSTEELDTIFNYLVCNYRYTPEEAVLTIISILEEREGEEIREKHAEILAKKVNNKE